MLIYKLYILHKTVEEASRAMCIHLQNLTNRKIGYVYNNALTTKFVFLYLSNLFKFSKLSIYAIAFHFHLTFFPIQDHVFSGSVRSIFVRTSLGERVFSVILKLLP